MNKLDVLAIRLLATMRELGSPTRLTCNLTCLPFSIWDRYGGQKPSQTEVNEALELLAKRRLIEVKYRAHDDVRVQFVTNYE